MLDEKTAIGQEDMQKVVQQIVDRFHPQKVILFGSYAYGVPTDDSDVDLLVVMDTRESLLRTAASISAAIDHPFPLDVMVMKPQQLQAALERKAIFAVEVESNGVVLYEA